MQSRYKVIIANKLLYREVELSSDAQRLVVGTDVGCDVRLHKSLFFEPVQLHFVRDHDSWSVICSDNLYLSAGDVRKLITRKLVHGDVLETKYQNSGQTLFTVEFLIDFDDGKRRYERCIDISGRSAVSIGACRGRDIVLSSAYTSGEEIQLQRSGGDYQLNILSSQFGVYHNGRKAVQGQRIANGDFLELSDFSFYLKDGCLWTQIRPDMFVASMPCADYARQDSYPLFRRSTRVRRQLNEEPIQVLDPPSMPEKPKNDLFMRLLPSLGMLLAAGVMASLGGSRMIIMSGISCAVAVITAVVNYRNNGKEYVETTNRRIHQYNAYIVKKREEIWKCREEERLALESIYLDQVTERSHMLSFSPALFDRSREDPDFLCLRLGTGAVEAVRKIEYKQQEKLEPEDELQMLPQRISKEFRHISRAPVVVDLKTVNGIGICGSEEHRFQMMKNIVLDLTSRHYHTDVKLVFVAREENKERVSWLRLLPYVYNAETGGRNIVCNDESRNLVFEYLYKELSEREQKKSFDQRIVVFFYDEYGFHTHPASRFLEKAAELGVTMIFFGQEQKDLPMGCGHLVELTGSDTGRLTDTMDAESSRYFTYGTISGDDMQKAVELLAPVYTEEISLEGSLTKSYSMFEMLDIISVDDLDLNARWEESRVDRSMSAPIGLTKSGMISLDLHDSAHGPHGLVAGTTGSGKSELLQTYILSMATRFAPSEVGFVIIDFKGGGMVNQFRDLPHLIGAITNIDGKQINRSLKSIKAELQKRQRCFAEADVNHIDKYIRKYKAGEVTEPLPHLIVIVDEFAELKAEQPEFMKELISAARIGRSLGVHLILATQKPSGQVSEQIWSNSRFKLCLKVQSRQDSSEVLKSPLAAEIKEPGRAYLQVGNNEIFELFQSAYSGMPEKTDDSSVKSFSIYELTDSGKRVPVYVQKKKTGDQAGMTQLDALVHYVHEHCVRNGIRRLPEICLPALSEQIPFPEEQSQAEEGSGILADIGVYDDPENQYQGTYTVDLTAQNLMVIGASRFGKTNLLQSILRSVSQRYTPREVVVYILDFGSMVLKNFEKLHHVGGVVTASEDEKLKNLFKLLTAEVEARKEQLIQAGVSSFAAYREAGYTDLPQILLMIDNLTALKELYLQEDDVLLNLCREGLSVGISIIAANAQTAGIGYKYLSNFASRIALFCTDSNEYNTLFDHCYERVEQLPGRCLVDMEKRHMDCQIYLPFQGEKEYERVAGIREYVAWINGKNPGVRARIIPVIPESLSQVYMEENFSGEMEKPFRLTAGLDYSTVTPFTIDFTGLGMLSITGREKSGKHNWVRYALNMLSRRYPGQLRVWAVDSIGRKTAWVRDRSYTEAYSVLPEDAAAYIKQMEKLLKVRYDALAAGNTDEAMDQPMLILLLDTADAVSAICADKEALAAYKNIVGRYRSLNGCILFSALENAAIPYTAPEIYKNIRDSRHILFFDDIANMKIFDVPLAISRAFRKPIEQGDGYYMKDNSCVKLKTPVSARE